MPAPRHHAPPADGLDQHRLHRDARHRDQRPPPAGDRIRAQAATPARGIDERLGRQQPVPAAPSWLPGAMLARQMRPSAPVPHRAVSAPMAGWASAPRLRAGAAPPCASAVGCAAGASQLVCSLGRASTRSSPAATPARRSQPSQWRWASESWS